MKEQHSNFYTLKQDGLFAVPDHIDLSASTIHNVRGFMNGISSRENTQYRATRREIFNILGVSSYPEITILNENPQRMQATSDRAYQMIGEMYGIEGSLSEIKTAVGGYAKGADNVIDYLRKDIFNGLSNGLELANEVQAENDPVKLLTIAFNEDFSPKPRFEAIRKLELMKLAAAIHQQERKSGVDDKFSQFIGFMNKNVWSKERRIGDVEDVVLISTHDPDTYSATKVEVIDKKESKKKSASRKGRKETTLPRRTFMSNGREIPAYVTIREKPDVTKIIKLLRKNDQNPATAVDDELGVMLVFDSTHDLRLFVDHLSDGAAQSGSQMTLEDISDTLNGGIYNNKNAGSSNEVQMLKFFARMQGTRIEFVLHTNETYVNQEYRKGVSHDEYEVNRVFDSGVIDLLFPQQLYDIDTKKVQEQAIKQRRAKIEGH